MHVEQRRFVSAALVLVAWSLGGPGAPGREPGGEVRLAVPVNGSPFQASLVAIAPDWKVTFDVGGTRRVLPATDLVYWGTYRDRYRAGQILLSNGSLLAAEVLGIGDDAVSLYGELWGRAQIPLRFVQGMMLDPPADPAERDRLYELIVSGVGGEDRLILENGDVIAGVVTGWREPPRSAPTGAPAIAITAEGRAVTMDVDRTAAVVFNPALLEIPRKQSFRTLIGFRDGSLLVVENLEWDRGFLRFRLPGPIVLEAGAESIWRDVVLLQPFAGAVRYLSDMEPVGYRHVPLLDLAWPFERDRNVLGGRLRSGGSLYVKGLGMHSTSRLAYDLDGRYQRFQAELAVDDRAGWGGSVVFRVFLPDASGEWKKAYESPIIRGGQDAVPMSVDIAGAQRMALIVDFAERGDVLDYADWLNARLVEQD